VMVVEDLDCRSCQAVVACVTPPLVFREATFYAVANQAFAPKLAHLWKLLMSY
jgi:hypothetical protein